MTALLSCQHLSKRFGAIQAVKDVSFSLAKGEVLGFLGPNGAGKTTTMRLITGFLFPSAGKIVVNGADMAEDPVAAKSCIGYLPEGAPLYGEMTVLAFLRFIARVRQVLNVETAVDRVIAACELHDVLMQPIETLSKGYRRRVGLAQALVHDPELLILDEPTDGLDPIQKNHIRELLRQIAREKAILISTHILDEVPALCNRVVIIHKGRIAADEKNPEYWQHKNLEAQFMRLGAA